MASPTFLELFRTLSSFSPSRVELRRAPWEAYVDWAISQGVAPLAAYNLEYRLAGANAPTWARDRLLSVYQGSANDNVMKLVNFKQIIGELEGRKVLLLGGAAFSEALYPHVAFRPVLDLQILVRGMELDPFAGFLAQHGFKPEPEAESFAASLGARKGLYDGRTPILVFAEILGAKLKEAERGVFERASPMRFYGPSVFRPSLEDALLLQCLELARRGFEVPALFFVDLRELLLGAPDMGGAYSHPCDTALVRQRATEWRLERSVYTSLAIVARLFPQTRELAEQAMPQLRGPTKRLLDRLVVDPVSDLGATRPLRGVGRLRQLLAGAHHA